MSGVVAASTIASVAAGLGSTIYGVVIGQAQLDAQQKSLKAQTRAQQKRRQRTIGEHLVRVGLRALAEAPCRIGQRKGRADR